MSKTEFVLRSLAEAKNTPPFILEQIAKKVSINDVFMDTLRQLLPIATASLLENIKTFVNKHQPLETVLWLRQNEGFREPILQQWRQLLTEMSEQEIETLDRIGRLGNKSSRERYLLEQHPEVYSLYGLVQQLQEPVRKTRNNRSLAIALVGNPNTPPEVRGKLQKQLTLPQNSQAEDRDWDMYLLALAFNSAISEEQREEYFKQILNSGTYARRTLAQHPQTPPHILAQLATTDAKYIVAENILTPPDTLRELAQQKDADLCHCVARTPSTPSEVLVQLVNASDPQLQPRKWNRFKFDNYKDWSKFLFEYPNMPKLELYRILLEKEAEEETIEAKHFITRKCPDIAQFREYVARYGDRSTRLNLAQMYKAPIYLLEQLAKDSDAAVRKQVSENANLPLHCLLELTKDPVVDIRLNLVTCSLRWKDTPVEILEVLAKDEAEQVREIVARNQNTPIEILTELAKDPSRKVKRQVATNPNTPIEVLEYLWREDGIFNPENHNTPSHVVVEAIANTSDASALREILQYSLKSYPQIPAAILEQLASHSDSIVRNCVADHPNTPSSVLERLADDDYSSTRWRIASNPNTPPHVLEQLLRKWENPDGEYNQQLCRPLAARTDAPAFVLDRIASSEFPDIRQRIASNPTTPLSTLARLAREESDDWVLSSVIHNPSLNQEIVEQLVQNGNPEVRLLAMDTPYITPQLWVKLARDPSPQVRRAIASRSNSCRSIQSPAGYRIIEHPQLPDELWNEFATDPSVEVRQAVAFNNNAPVEILELLALDADPEVRQYLPNNPNTPINVLKRLSQDKIPSVRQQVAASDRTPVNLLEKLAIDPNQKISQALINNPNTPTSLKQSLPNYLGADISPTIKGLSRLYNPKTDVPTLLSEYVESPTPFVRFISLQHLRLL